MTLLLAAFLAGSVAQTSGVTTTTSQPRLFQGLGGKPIVPIFAVNDAKPFKPQPTVRITTHKAPALAARANEERDVICGTVVIRKSPEMDSGMLIPPRETGAAVRRIEPEACRAKK
jgi:hypothetical protein